MIQDLRYAARILGRSPGFTLVAVVTLALGIGGSATLFTWLNAVLLQPLPGVVEVGRLVNMVTTDDRGPGFVPMSYPDYRDYRDGSRSFAGLLGQEVWAMSLVHSGQAERIWGMLVTANYFDVLGVRARYGRTFRPEEDGAPGAHPVVVLADGLWQRRFGSDPGIVGKTVSLNAREFTVVGIAPPEFRGSIMGLGFDAWVPTAMHPVIIPGGSRTEERGRRGLGVLARLKPGVDLRRAQAELAAIAARLGKEYPASNEGRGVGVFPLSRTPVGATRFLAPVLLVLAAAVGLVLLIACANVANLLLARATGRRREIAVRLALGASRPRIFRQLLTESLLLALLGGAAGVLVAGAGADLLMAFAPPNDFPVSLAVDVEARALAFTLAVSLLTALLFGLAPALRASRPDVASVLKDETGTTSGGAGRARLRSFLVVGQVALSLLLLVAAGLLLRSFQRAQAFDPGLDPRGVLLASIDLFPGGYTRETGPAFLRRLLERAGSLPGVESVSLARRVPLGMGGTSSQGFEVEGYAPPPDLSVWAYANAIGAGYFGTLRIAVLRGREFAASDDERAPAVAVVNETMARRYWPGREALGGRIRLGEQWVTVVGVVRDSKYNLLSEPPVPHLFRPILQAYRGDVTLLVRTRASPASLADEVRSAVRELDPALPVFGLRTMEAHVGFATFQQRMAGTLLSILGGLALVLAAVGIYGVLAYSVSQRTREIGIRVALGGSPRDILGLVLRQAMGLTLAGLGIGLAASLLATPLLGRLLFGVSPLDLATFAGVTLLLGGVAFTACSVPAHRAMHIDPTVALRYE